MNMGTLPVCGSKLRRLVFRLRRVQTVRREHLNAARLLHRVDEDIGLRHRASVAPSSTEGLPHSSAVAGIE
ncbi:hypothetical protein EYF80_034084 [Liparis tanakae]|uniref:Uncharacterized protein n=1 Tax=Liparis tanakae TaxID=230148 RepID=A0A4Z2GQR3_9TELE|nr:hypothetical protein EYF80_034084 [Liparis tanakae]